MYKNFTLTESERKEILGMHRENGYGRPLNEDEETYKINQGIQCFLNKKGIKDNSGQPLKIDGSIGNYPNSKSAQAIHNYQSKIGVYPADGVWGPDTMDKMPPKDKELYKECLAEYGDIIDKGLHFFGLDEETEVDELDHAGFHDRDDLQVLRDSIDRNKMVSVAFVKKDGTVRHMLVRKSLKSYVGSDAEKTDAQMNVEANHDLKKVVDINAYKRELKRLRNENPDMDPEEMKTMAAKTCWRSISLKNVLGFMVGGQFIDLRDENDIMGRFGEEVNNSLTKSMVNAMNQEVAQEEEPEVENEPHAPEPGQENPEENIDGPINESLDKIRSEFKRFL
jgi:hypothetical protein